MAKLKSAAAMTAIGGVSVGRTTSSTRPLDERRWEMWMKLGKSVWRSVGEGGYSMLVLRAQKEIEHLEDVGKEGQIAILELGDFPDHRTEGEFKARSVPWPS